MMGEEQGNNVGREKQEKIICVGTKGGTLVVGYTQLDKLSENYDPEITLGFSIVENGIESAISEALNALDKRGIVPISVRDYVDDRYWGMEDKHKGLFLR